MKLFGPIRINDSKGNEYVLEVELDLLEAASGKLTAKGRGLKWDRDTGFESEASFAVEYDAFEGTITVTLEDGTVARFRIGEDDKLVDPDDEILDSELIFDQLRNLAADDTGVDTLIQAIPVEPGLGCLIKSGISTTVGQIINCHRQTAGKAEGTRRLFAVLRCLRVNSWATAAKFVGRTLKCWALAGLG